MVLGLGDRAGSWKRGGVEGGGGRGEKYLCAIDNDAHMASRRGFLAEMTPKDGQVRLHPVLRRAEEELRYY